MAILIARGVAAARLDLFGDEAFYWLCSQRLALAYADHPFMTAALVRGGSALLGPIPLGVRAPFLVLGALLPWSVYLIARPLFGRRDALLAAGAALLVPLFGVGGILAVPDVPLVLLSSLALLAFERATRTGHDAAWLAAGAATALALATHTRAVLIPLAFLLYLAGTARGRAAWRRPGPWLAFALLCSGLLPGLLFNLEHGFAPLRFQLADRHAGAPGLAGVLDHLRLQALAVSPPLYAALLAVLAGLLRRAARGDDRAALLAAFAIAHLGVFLLASPFADPDHTTLHWTAAGYLPLLAALPGWLRAFVARRPTRVRRALAAAVPGFALVCTAVLHLELATRAFGAREVGRVFGGFSAAAAAARDALARVPALPDGRVLLVADDYLLAGNLDLRLLGRVELYVLDHPKHADHGRALQLRIWGIDEAGLRGRRSGASALVVADRDQSRSAAWGAWRRHIAARFDTLQPIAEVAAESRRDGPRFYLFHGAGVRAGPP